MSEFEVLAQHLLKEAEAEEKLRQENDKKLIEKVLEIYDQKYVAELLRKVGKNEWSRETINRWINGKCLPKSLTSVEESLLRKMLPEPPANHPEYAFRFIDLFAGIGGIRKGFEAIGGQCVFTSEWNKDAVRTYKANWFNDEQVHKFNLDIREVTLSDKTDVLETDAYAYIDEHVPDHDVLLAGFPCQPFSLAGVSKKNSLGRAHGFECEAQGTLFFDVARIIRAKKPAIFVLDEATSSIDTVSEQLIQEATDKLLRGHTSFVIAHRLSTIRKADLILVVKDGKIIEQGTHKELLSEKGYYHDLYHKQFEEESARKVFAGDM